MTNRICPIAGCPLESKTCPHLDQFLEYDSSAPMFKVETFSTDEIEDFPVPEPEKGRMWALFKKLRKYGVERDQIGILLRKFCLEYSREQIKTEMGWTSNSSLERRYKAALRLLKQQGFKLGKGN